MIPGEYHVASEPIPAGTAIRFEPGETKTVQLIDFGGKRRIFGFNNKVNGFLD